MTPSAIAAFDPATDIKGWGVAGWIPITGDWNGDGKTDLGAINPANMTWFRDMNGDFAFNPATEISGWGSPGDTPVVGDWDDDGDDDLGCGFQAASGLSTPMATKRSTRPATFSVGAWPAGRPWWATGTGTVPPTSHMNGERCSTPRKSRSIRRRFTGGNWFRDMNGRQAAGRTGAFDASQEVVIWGTPGNTSVVVDWDRDAPPFFHPHSALPLFEQAEIEIAGDGTGSFT